MLAALRIEFGTHTHASVNGWDYPATWADLMSTLLTERTLNYWRHKDDRPVELPRPWPKYEQVDSAELARLTALLEKHSAFNR